MRTSSSIILHAYIQQTCTMKSGVSPVIFKQTVMRQSLCFPWNRCSSSACQPTECSPSSVCGWSSMLSRVGENSSESSVVSPPNFQSIILAMLCLLCNSFIFCRWGMLGVLLSCMVPFKGHMEYCDVSGFQFTQKKPRIYSFVIVETN